MRTSPLFTDLYELTMAQAYASEQMDERAVFELTFRKMPANRNYIAAAGIGDVIDFLSDFHFEDRELDYLGQYKEFSKAFLERLKNLRFTGDVYALPEGTPVFPNEPIVQMVAPIIEAQLMETLVLNQVHFQSLALAKAARVVEAAGGRGIVDFGSRRAHGTDAALKVARATYLAGGSGTSNVLAGQLYGIPVFGTMAHSYVQAHDCETASFEAFAGLYPETTILVDTYDTFEGVRKVIELSRKPGRSFRVQAIRLDSGDLGALACGARKMLDEAGLRHVTIFASSGLDEYEIQRLVNSGAPIDAFGVGTRLAVMEDASHLDMAYKLVEYGGKGRLKLSPGKVLYPGRKQVFRQSENGCVVRDVVGRFDEQLPGKPLLQPVMQRGAPITHVKLEESRQRFQSELASLPSHLRALQPSTTPYPVSFSECLERDLQRIRIKLAHGT
ncbi:MAG TPA: nicotinate phosphoribosyltransferase [Bryobacteraceae bacterium]|nr:nicotinate phosphoribosyltransferase [Bryobacteraceae bacterium]